MVRYKPYVVISPPYDVTSGGIRVMYGLRSWLETKGQIVYMNEKPPFGQEFVAIYPEIMRGNGANANKVVRYILQTPGVMATYGIPGPSTEEIRTTSDEIIVFSKIYDTIGVDDDHILFLPILNTHLFQYQKTSRKGTCYLVGKGTNQHKHPPSSIELTREMAADQAELARVLNNCHTFYCYDRLTAMMDIARLCGCRVKYYGDFSPFELEKYETGMNGIGYQDQDVKLVPDAFREHYLGMVDTFSKKLDLFIERTQA